MLDDIFSYFEIYTISIKHIVNIYDIITLKYDISFKFFRVYPEITINIKLYINEYLYGKSLGT